MIGYRSDGGLKNIRLITGLTILCIVIDYMVGYMSAGRKC